MCASVYPPGTSKTTGDTRKGEGGRQITDQFLRASFRCRPSNVLFLLQSTSSPCSFVLFFIVSNPLVAPSPRFGVYAQNVLGCIDAFHLRMHCSKMHNHKYTSAGFRWKQHTHTHACMIYRHTDWDRDLTQARRGQLQAARDQGHTYRELLHTTSGPFPSSPPVKGHR